MFIPLINPNGNISQHYNCWGLRSELNFWWHIMSSFNCRATESIRKNKVIFSQNVSFADGKLGKEYVCLTTEIMTVHKSTHVIFRAEQKQWRVAIMGKEPSSSSDEWPSWAKSLECTTRSGLASFTYWLWGLGGTLVWRSSIFHVDCHSAAPATTAPLDWILPSIKMKVLKNFAGRSKARAASSQNSITKWGTAVRVEISTLAVSSRYGCRVA